jgi:hypothetical protein
MATDVAVTCAGVSQPHSVTAAGPQLLKPRRRRRPGSVTGLRVEGRPSGAPWRSDVPWDIQPTEAREHLAFGSTQPVQFDARCGSPQETDRDSSTPGSRRPTSVCRLALRVAWVKQVARRCGVAPRELEGPTRYRPQECPRGSAGVLRKS